MTSQADVYLFINISAFRNPKKAFREAQFSEGQVSLKFLSFVTY